MTQGLGKPGAAAELWIFREEERSAWVQVAVPFCRGQASPPGKHPVAWELIAMGLCPGGPAALLLSWRGDGAVPSDPLQPSQAPSRAPFKGCGGSGHPRVLALHSLRALAPGDGNESLHLKVTGAPAPLL